MTLAGCVEVTTTVCGGPASGASQYGQASKDWVSLLTGDGACLRYYRARESLNTGVGRWSLCTVRERPSGMVGGQKSLAEPGDAQKILLNGIPVSR